MTREGKLAGLLGPANTCKWTTPRETYEELDREFGFTMDPCPANDEMGGLQRAWKGVVWCNPPYGRTISKWIARGLSASQEGATVVMLLPSRTDTRWWHDYCMKGEIRFIRGRLKFGNATNAAPFPSAIVIFRPAEADRRAREGGTSKS